MLSVLLAHIEQQNPHIKSPRVAWQLNPFELADAADVELPDDYVEYEERRLAALAARGDG